MRSRKLLYTASLLGFTLLLAPGPHAGTLGLAWNSSANATGYRVHYGPNPGNYTNTVDVGNTTQATLNSLGDCSTWYFAVTAYNGAGSSGFSDEVSSWPRPTVSSASPAKVMQGRQVTLTINGGSFADGATLEIDNPHVFLENVATVSCGEIELLATVEPTAAGVRPAEVGKFRVTVANPSGLSGSKNNGFEVLIDPARFDVNQADEKTSGRIDGKDTIWLSRHFGSREGDALYEPDFDFNGDGWVDGEELARLAGNLGRCWNGSNWTANSCPSSLR
jgi:hypothetical protein